jgi:hypothetical protein
MKALYGRNIRVIAEPADELHSIAPLCIVVLSRMEQIVLQLKNTRKRKLLLDLLSELSFVQVTSVIRDGRKMAFANDLLDAMMEAKADARGEKKLTRARDFLKHG